MTPYEKVICFFFKMSENSIIIFTLNFSDTRGRESHLLFTLHVYQYSVNGPSGASGGRSRLHLIDFGGCERTKTPGGGITLSGLGNVILGIFNGQKHLPHRDR